MCRTIHCRTNNDAKVYIYTSVTLYTLSIDEVKSNKVYQLMILLQKDICHDTQQTVQQVATCPENDKSYLERSISKQCDNYPPCMGKPLVYHCIKYEGDLVEVCSPRTK